MRAFSLAVLVAAVLVFPAGCSRSKAVHLRRLAILPPEILVEDETAKWLAAALPLIWDEDLATASDTVAEVVHDSSSATQFGASEILYATVERRAGRLRLAGTLTDTATQRNISTIEVQSNDSTAILPLANAFAKRIDRGATAFSTGDERALQAFVGALEMTAPAARIDGLKTAIGIDPAFGLAYIALAQAEAQAAPAALPDLLTQAGQQAGSFTPLDRAKFNALASQALHAPIAQQRIALRTLLQIAPNTLDALAQLGALRFLQGDATNGEAVMARALELSPGNPALLEQLGKGYIETRQFAQAEKTLTGLDENPAVLPSLAICILLEGDAGRANAVSERFARSLPPEVQVLYRAYWTVLAGGIDAGLIALAGQRFANAPLQSAASAEVVIWHAMKNDFAGARQSLAADAGGGAFTAESQLLSRADEPLDDWLRQVESASLGPDQKQSLLAFGTFLAGHYDKSAEYWQGILTRSGGTDLRARAMLAAALDRSGQAQAAQKISVQPFVPEFGDLYAAVSFREMRRLLNL